MVTKSASMKKLRERSQARRTESKAEDKSINSTRVAEKVILAALVFAAVFWVFQSIVDVVLFREGSFVGQLLTPGLHEIWMRTVVICTLIMFGVYAQSILRQREQVQETLEKKTHDLDERVKEVDCLYGISDLATKEDTPLEHVLENAASLICTACRYPEITCGRIILTGREFKTRNFEETAWKLVHNIIVQGKRTGTVEVRYLEEKPELEEGPFLKEEVNLVSAVARQLGEIIERRQVDEALRRSEGRYRTTLKEIQDSYFETDLVGNFTFFNDAMCRAVGYSREELTGMSYRIITAEEDVAGVYRTFNQIYRTGEPVKAFAWKAIRKDGTAIFAEASAAALRNTEGETVGFRCVARDITERRQAEEALGRSEERYRTILTEIQDGYFETDIGGNFTFANDSLARILGYSREDLIGVNNRAYMDEENAKSVYRSFNKVYRTGESNKGFSYQIIRKDGSARFIEVSVSPLRSEEGETVGFRGVMRDITERKHAEEALRQSEERYRTILKEMRDGYYEVDLAGNFTFVNDSACRYLGYSRDEMMGMNYRVYTAKEDVDSVFKVFNQVYRTSEPVEGFSWKAIRKDGTRGFAEASVSALRNDEGQVVGFRCVGRDVTEREQAEDALRQSEERYRTILGNIEDGYFEVDLRGNYTFFNDSLCRVLGYSRDEMMGMNYRTYTPKKDVRAVFKAFNEVYRTGKPIDGFSWQILRKDGSRRFGEVSVSPLRDVVGSTIGFRGIHRDITERKRAEMEREALLRDITTINRRLQQSNKELQDFAYVASHDLREPLRKISSFGTLLQDSLQGKLDEDEEENFEFMIDGAGRMQTMIDALLAYSRVNTKAKPSEQVDLYEVIEHLKKVELAARLDESNGAIHVLEPLPPVNGDPSQIHQLLQNLIGNGLKFQREGIPPEIAVRAYQVDGKTVRVEVQDNGIGIDKEYHQQVFSMFKRLHSRARYEGTGIGLAVCKRIVERHGGEIAVDSTPDGGSTFWFTLPRGSYSGVNQSKK